MKNLWLTPEEIAKTTIVGGNVERDSYSICIEWAQNTVIEPLLGTLLYDKIDLDNQNNTLEGDYLILFNDYINPILKNSTIAKYVPISNLRLGNKGLMRMTSENSETVSDEEKERLASTYESLAQTGIIRFEKWIKNNPLPEYLTIQDEVNATEIQNSFDWRL